jgi:hypothetical protein
MKCLPDYHWKEFWSAILGLLAFLSNKLENLVTTGGVEELVRQVCGLVQLELVENYLNELYQTISLLDLALCKAEGFLPAQSIHEFIVSHGSRSVLMWKQSVEGSVRAGPVIVGSEEAGKAVTHSIYTATVIMDGVEGAANSDFTGRGILRREDRKSGPRISKARDANHLQRD